ncbi:MAG: D-2-hydroxyacid dehydrogenase family protein [Deltaproteobacteria bacterium]|nr:D-2-hydroxyacid dehydrogenase family protein [Deltaproteobacteria bacterium]
MKVAILDDYQKAFEGSPAIRRLKEKAEVQIFTEKFPSEEALIAALEGAQAIIPIRERTAFPARLLKALPDLEIIAQTGNHAYHLDLEAATEAGILVTLAPGGSGVTELTFGLMIDLMRRISLSDRQMRQGQWPLVLGVVLKGKTLGILGLGRVGLEVARIAQAFDMKIIAWGPTLNHERAQRAGATYLDLEELLKTADVVSVHLKLSDQSKGLLDESKLRLMRKSAFLINTARGAIVDEAALVKILQEGLIAGAALDVYCEEPLPADSPLRHLDNVVLAPHLGWPTDDGFRGFAETAVENILDYMQGKTTRALNPQALEKRKGFTDSH